MSSFFLFLLVVIEVILGLVTFVFAVLRETHEFWLHSGGYPLFLRDLVLVSFFPLVTFNFCALISLTTLCAAKVRGQPGLVAFFIMLILLGWGLFFGAVGIALKNNLENYLEGRPIHAKPPFEQRGQ
jgi:hypothetical protein